MKYLKILTITVLVMFSMATKGWTADESVANRQTFLNNVTDFFATVGESDKQAQQTINKRKAERRKNRLNAMKSKENARMRKQMNRQKTDIMKKINAPYGN